MKDSFITVKLTFFFIIVILFLISHSCEKDATNPVPDTYVNVYINLISSPLGISQAMIITKAMVGATSLGYDNNGIIVYRYSQDEFFAYDRTCPFHIENSTSVNLMSDNLFAICPKCSSIYQLFYNGFPTDDSSSEYPLKQYNTSFNQNSQDLHIFN